MLSVSRRDSLPCAIEKLPLSSPGVDLSLVAHNGTVIGDEHDTDSNVVSHKLPYLRFTPKIDKSRHVDPLPSLFLTRALERMAFRFQPSEDVALHHMQH